MGNCCGEGQVINDHSAFKMSQPEFPHNLESDRRQLNSSRLQEAIAPIALPGSKMKLVVMNTPNPKVIEVLASLPHFTYPREQSYEPGKPIYGPYQYPGGATYTGQYINFQRSGKGRQVWKDGSVYEGFWIEDKPHGFGRQVYEEGDVYEGEWVAGWSSGMGTYTKVDGGCYTGEWVDNVRSGVGKETYGDGSVYEGGFKRDLRHGIGRMCWSDGSKYEGEFLNDGMHGEGQSK